MAAAPSMTQFRAEPQGNGLIHLVFDCPGRTMNVFSNAAIEELGAHSSGRLIRGTVPGSPTRPESDNPNSLKE